MQTPDQIFNDKAYYNKWLKQLTESEKELILEMLEEIRLEGFESGYRQAKNEE